MRMAFRRISHLLVIHLPGLEAIFLRFPAMVKLSRERMIVLGKYGFLSVVIVGSFVLDVRRCLVPLA